jgi:hypothetical protein
MPLTKKGKKIKKSFKKQYGKNADKVFYASANKGTLKGVIKKAEGGNFDYEGDAYGTTPASSYSSPSYGENGSGQAYSSKTIGKTKDNTSESGSGSKSKLGVTAAVSAIGKGVFDVSGLGLIYEGGKKVASKVKQITTPQIKKDISSAALSGSQIFKVPTKRTAPLPSGGDNGGSDPVQPILKKPIPTAKKATDSFSASGFFPFKAYKSGGVRFGPPPKRGPNPLVPPVKMRTGGRGTCPHRPDGIKGVGKAIKGFKFIGVK